MQYLKACQVKAKISKIPAPHKDQQLSQQDKDRWWQCRQHWKEETNAKQQTTLGEDKTWTPTLDQLGFNSPRNVFKISMDNVFYKLATKWQMTLPYTIIGWGCCNILVQNNQGWIRGYQPQDEADNPSRVLCYFSISQKLNLKTIIIALLYTGQKKMVTTVRRNDNSFLNVQK